MIILEGTGTMKIRCRLMLHNQLPMPGSTSVTRQNVLTRAMGYTSALALSVFYLLVRLNIDLIFFSKWWVREIRCRMLHNEPIPLPIIQECFEHWCTVQNVLILWDGGSSC